MITNVDTTFKVFSSLEEQLLLVTVEKEAHLKIILMTLTKGPLSLEEYLSMFKSIYNDRLPSTKPMLNLNKVFQFAQGLGLRYKDFRMAILTKPPP